MAAAVLRHCREGQQAAVHRGMQRLDPAVHHLGKAGEVRIAHREPGIGERLAVPPVETSSTPWPASARAKSTRPVLSETEMRAREMRRKCSAVIGWRYHSGRGASCRRLALRVCRILFPQGHCHGEHPDIRLSGLVPVLGTCYVETMRVIARNVLVTFWASTRKQKSRWNAGTSLSKPRNGHPPDDIRTTAPKAKVLNRERVRFEVAGGNYRLVTAFDFRRQIAFVKFIGTHAEYDRIDALTVSQF